MAAKKKSKGSPLAVIRDMYRSRYLDQKMFRLSRQNKGAALQLSAEGHEMIGVTVAHALQAGEDWAYPYYRDQPFGVGYGCALDELIGAFLTRETSHHSKGRMMPAHFSHKEMNMPPQSSVVGSQYLQAVGCAKGLQLSKKKGKVVYVSGGDGSTSQGDFHEALNFASIHQLPVLFVIQDNGWAISVPASEQTTGQSVKNLATGYQPLHIEDVDGTDYDQVGPATERAVEFVRSGQGPALIVAHIPRLAPHSNSDDHNKYKTDKDFTADRQRDPIAKMEAYLLKHDLASEKDLQNLQEAAEKEVEEASKQAETLPFPSADSVCDHLYAEQTEMVSEEDPAETGEEIVMVDALNHALREEMERDPRVCVFGQDVAHGKGGVFGVTQGLTKTFGKERCFNTPLAESTIVGVTTGLATTGHVIPVAEVQFADYLWPGMNQLGNEQASICYRSGGEWNCPSVIRMPTGGYIQGGPYHSQNIEAFLAHMPGLQVVYPSNAADAKALLKASIRNPNPVVFLEHKAIYRQRKFAARKEPDQHTLLQLGKAKVVREGEDLTVISWGMMVALVNELAGRFAREGNASIELIDLRTISPWDRETVLASVKKTGRALIVHEACLTGGFGGEIAATLAQEAFEYLDAPIRRHCAYDIPVPYSKVLEDAMLPSVQTIENEVRSLLSY